MKIEMKGKIKKVAVLYGGLSAERDISVKSGIAVARALRRKGYHVIEIDVDRTLPEQLSEISPEAVFIALHGPIGEDGTIQGLLEIMNIPYTGSGHLGSAIAMDKVRTKYLLKSAGIPTPQWIEMKKGKILKPDFPLPWVVKPSTSGSSIGISIVRKEEELERAVKRANAYSEEVLVEKLVGKWEITTAVFNGEVLGTLQIKPKGEFYNFSAKYEKGRSEYIIPPEVPEKIVEKAEDYARRTYELLSLAGAARIDMRANDKQVYIFEANTIPGLTETSLLPMIAKFRGISFEELCEKMVLSARTYVRV